MFEKVISKAIDTIADPVLIILFLIIIGLFFMVYYKDKCLQVISKDHHNEINSLSQSIASEVQELSKITEKQITLLEFLIYNKGGDSRR